LGSYTKETKGAKGESNSKSQISDLKSSGSGNLPEVGGGVSEEAAVAEDLELLADFVADVAVVGMEGLELDLRCPSRHKMRFDRLGTPS